MSKKFREWIDSLVDEVREAMEWAIDAGRRQSVTLHETAGHNWIEVEAARSSLPIVRVCHWDEREHQSPNVQAAIEAALPRWSEVADTLERDREDYDRELDAMNHYYCMTR